MNVHKELLSAENKHAVMASYNYALMPKYQLRSIFVKQMVLFIHFMATSLALKIHTVVSMQWGK